MNPAINQEVTLLKDFLDKENEIGILIGGHQNLDTYAAALSLYLSLSQSGKKVQIISKRAPTVEVSNLVGIDRVKASFAGNTSKLVVALPYIKGEVEKVLFTEAPDTINFHLTAAPDRSITPFELNDVKLMWEGGAPSAIIAIGVGSIDELAAVADPNVSKVVNIDNFQGNSRFGNVVLVDEMFSSLSEIVGKVIKDLTLPMDIDIAQNLMDGVMFATRGFTKGNTSPLAFETVSSAMYHGAQRKMEEQPRRDQGMGAQNRQPMPQHDRSHEPRHQSQPHQQAQRHPRVNENDFPAMHMQTNQRPIHDQNRDRRGNQGRPAMPSQPQQRQNMPQQPQNPQRTMNDIRNKLMEENRSQQQYQNQNVEDAQVIEDPRLSAMPMDDIKPQERQSSLPIEDVVMPQEQPYVAPNEEDVPDDWLMPKVFKSSKNNN